MGMENKVLYAHLHDKVSAWIRDQVHELGIDTIIELDTKTPDLCMTLAVEGVDVVSVSPDFEKFRKLQKELDIVDVIFTDKLKGGFFDGVILRTDKFDKKDLRRLYKLGIYIFLVCKNEIDEEVKKIDGFNCYFLRSENNG
jgi:hypothetical protein